VIAGTQSRAASSMAREHALTQSARASVRSNRVARLALSVLLECRVTNSGARLVR
jgi:hypothetical protein